MIAFKRATSAYIASPTSCMTFTGGTTISYRFFNSLLKAYLVHYFSSCANSCLVAFFSTSYFIFVICLVWLTRDFLHCIDSSFNFFIVSSCLAKLPLYSCFEMNSCDTLVKRSFSSVLNASIVTNSSLNRRIILFIYRSRPVLTLFKFSARAHFSTFLARSFTLTFEAYVLIILLKNSSLTNILLRLLNLSFIFTFIYWKPFKSSTILLIRAVYFYSSFST